METGAKSQPKLANENPWYCLATLHGEQRGTEIDHDLAARNRVAWNRWMAAGRLGPRLGDEQRADLLRRNLPKADLTELTPHQQREFYELFAARTGCARILVPNPDDIVDFRHTQFDVPFSFCGFICVRQANFDSARFVEQADFSEAIFFGDTYFPGTTFIKNAYFYLSTFCENASFNSANFLENAFFINTRFDGITDFQKAAFTTLVPDFRGAKLHEGTEWEGIKWPEAPSGEAAREQVRRAAREQVRRYERLKLEMDRLKKHEAEQMFFAKELRAAREIYPVLSMGRLLNFLYELLADYGQSILRPLLWLFLLFALGTVLFAVVPVLHGGGYISIDRAAGFSLASIFSFLQKREMASYSVQAQVIGAVETIIGLILLFLLGLALRNKFRMK